MQRLIQIQGARVMAGLVLALLGSFVLCVFAEGGDAERGYRFLTEKAYLPADFNEEILSQVWKVWPEPLRSQAEAATPLERRHLIFSRYGLTVRPGEEDSQAQFAPLQYVVSQNGTWTMNCLSCHGGNLLGKPVPGLPNARYALQTLSEEMRETRMAHFPGSGLTRMEKASVVLPLGTSRGTTNAVTFGILLMAFRDQDLNIRSLGSVTLPRFVHHDMDAPAWWIYRKKKYLYTDAYIPRGHRSLMQFMLVRQNGPEKFREWEADFEDIETYLLSLQAPRYPFSMDAGLVRRGEQVFLQHCAECHGTYGKNETYPNRVVEIDEIGTDPVRFHSILPSDRAMFGKSWFAHYGADEMILETQGYLAPPLDGIWASAPYFHNGSVPTLWHILHPDQRPVVWRNTSEDGYDQQRAGFVVEELQQVPPAVTNPRERREYFETRVSGKSAAGHDYPDALSEEEKAAVLEYLKTL